MPLPPLPPPMAVGGDASVADGDRRICADCGTPVRSYKYRFYPPESVWYERCIGLAWCNGCRIYCGSLVHVPRTEVIVDPLASLPADERERLVRNDTRLIKFLERQARQPPQAGAPRNSVFAAPPPRDNQGPARGGTHEPGPPDSS
ncbi:hypothetical protein ACKI1K_11760 [Streptomyces scabiei]|uniref:hypothetical protein n=1 Tax=Streptomyces scabiei TaxID=1930 RepID=UPI00131DF016|nr:MULTISPECIES: hypothetical protein [Streptomyces]MBP5859594.1 hypothetical protein [Streptomyces sp. LBUM 1484]QTU50088.1 hypothetical protein F3K20_39480 [Streptomyces sp. LBUM 1482]QTU66308.1 hypothetical protein F3K22_39585 [Streptomyces sp. LBUM 1475]MBP5880197.1 hypothetical protein [Streptomyces sp. LBUM 1477]MBP5888034.1 hypothetical protein [Streptomyces sp. LBUM 1487]